MGGSPGAAPPGEPWASAVADLARAASARPPEQPDTDAYRALCRAAAQRGTSLRAVVDLDQ